MINIIAAIGRHRELGKDNKLLWHIPSDMKFFREKTVDHPVIMGRKTFESIGKPLPKRTNIVVTRNSSFEQEGVIVKHSIESAISFAESLDADEVFIIGGAQIYRQSLPLVDRLYLTRVNKLYEADTFFPEFESLFKKIESHNGAHGNLEFAFTIWDKK